MNRSSHRLRGRSSRLARRSGAAATTAELMELALDPDRCQAVAEKAVLVMLAGGSQAEVRVADARGLRVADLEETRRPLSHGSMRNYIGYCPVPSPRGRRSVWFESLNELNHLRDLILDGRADEVATQPFLIVWRLPNGQLTHTPDIIAVHPGGRTCLYDIKSRDAVSPAVTAQSVMTAATAACAGWDYELRTELPGQRARNLAYLHKPHPVDGELVAGWLGRLAGCEWPMPLEEVAQCLSAGPQGRAAVLHLVGSGSLHLDLDLPITGASPISNTPLKTGTSPWILKI